MTVNLSDVFSSNITKQVTISYKKPVFSDGIMSYDVVSEVPAQLTFTGTENGKARITGKGSITLKMQCGRCLTDMEVPVEYEIDRMVYAPDLVTEEIAEEQPFVEEYLLDGISLITDEILLAMPMKVLCRSDCKGICKVCGKNLNLTDCGHDQFVPDPRMAAIKDIFEQNFKA